MPEAESPERHAPDSLMLFGFWYRALPADKLEKDKLTKALLLETPLVLGRDSSDLRPLYFSLKALVESCASFFGKSTPHL